MFYLVFIKKKIILFNIIYLLSDKKKKPLNDFTKDKSIEKNL